MAAYPSRRRISASSNEPVAVTVVIPCFNSAATLPETVDSVLAQVYRNFEIVFVDDGSVDHTPAVVEQLTAAEPRIAMRLIRQANAGTAAARNRAIAAARGRYVLPLDADDVIEPTMLERCAAALDARPDLDLVYTDRRDFGDVSAVQRAGSFSVERLKYFNQLGYCSLYRRSAWEAIGGYRTNVTGFDDWDFWLALALRGCRAHHVPLPLFRHRRHAGSLLWRIVPRFERLHAQIMLNNSAAYSGAELRMARRTLEGGEPGALLRCARIVFMARYFAAYPPALVEASCA